MQKRLPCPGARAPDHLYTDGEYDLAKSEAERERLRDLPDEERITEREYFRCDADLIRVDIINDVRSYKTRLVVNGKPSRWHDSCENMIVSDCSNYVMFAPYWESYIEPCSVPMRLLPAVAD